MGCILACLRFKDDKKKKKAHLKSSPVPSKTKEPLLFEDQFVSVFVSEGSPCERVTDLNFQDDNKYILDREFGDEVKFLKSCGAILLTPAELRRASDKLFAQRPNKDVTTSGSSSCLPGTPFKKLVWDEQQEDSNVTQNSSAGFNFGEHQAQRHNDSALSLATLRKPGPESAESAVLDVFPAQDDTQIQPHGTNGSVSLESVALDSGIESRPCSAVLDVSRSQDDTQIRTLDSNGVCSRRSVKHVPENKPGAVSVVLDVSPSQADTQVQPFGAKHSPYPTPLKLTDEMETPGTIYPASLENLRRKNARIRTQYVYPVENQTQSEKRREGSKQLGQAEKVQQTPIASSINNHNDKRSLNRDELDKENYGSVKRPRSLTPLSDSRWKLTPNPENRQIVVSSLSQWLKPPPGDDKKSQPGTSAMKYSCPDRTPEVDRPIFGVVAMHWNEDDPSKVSPKWWGGNGIPNTTTKYKEDQKVSWHTTPFEERLVKALSDDKLFPQRKHVSRNLVAFKDEGEESDTASF